MRQINWYNNYRRLKGKVFLQREKLWLFVYKRKGESYGKDTYDESI